MQVIVFTDLDGTLLDAVTYSAEGSRSALQSLTAAGVPVIFCSAKNRAEQIPIREALGIHGPYIVENGSAVFVPRDSISLEDAVAMEGNQCVVLGLPAHRIHALLDRVRYDTGLAFQGFADLTTAQVAEITGLDMLGAERARQRDFSETVVTQFSSDDLLRFQQSCAAHGLKCPSGGRFMTITGAGADKGQAVRLLTEAYRAPGQEVMTVGIGDSLNDAPMLATVDRAFLVQRPGGVWSDVDVLNLTRVNAVGPAGFVMMATSVLETVQ